MAAGYKTGGRGKGVPNKATVLLHQQQDAARRRIAEVLGTEVFPGDALDFMRMVYKDMAMPMSMRLDAAAKALPYERRKLPTEVELSNEISGPQIQIAHFTRILDAPLVDGDNNITPLLVGPEDKGPEQD